MSISRCNFLRASAGAATAGLALDPTLSKPLFATEEAHRECPAPTLVLWATPIPEGAARANLDIGTAEIHVRNICSVLDTFSVENSLTPTRPLGNPVSAVIDSLDIEWSGVTRSVLGFSDPVNQFSGDFFETSASMQLVLRTLAMTGHGFRFVSSSTTAVSFAQFGRERNCVFF